MIVIAVLNPESSRKGFSFVYTLVCYFCDLHLKSFLKPISFEIADEGRDFEAPGQAAGEVSATNPSKLGEMTNWSDWSSCFPECGSVSTRTRTRSCDNSWCFGHKEETEPCSLG